MAQKNHFTVVRNAAYSGGEFNVRERHNERKNNSLFAEVKDFLSAIRNFPQKLREFIDAHWQKRRQQRSHSREVTL